MPQNSHRSKTLFIRFSSLGDIILTESTLRAYKQYRPNGEIHFLTKEIYRDAVELMPSVDRVISIDTHTRLRSAGLSSIISSLRKNGYGTVIDLQINPGSILVSLSINASERSSYSKASLKRRLMTIGFCRNLRVEHTARRYFSSLDFLGIDASGVDFRPKLDPGNHGLREARRLLEDIGWYGKRSLVAVIPGAKWPSKRWPADYFAEFIKMIHAETGSLCVILGSVLDRPVSRQVLSHLSKEAADLSGRTGLVELAAILQIANLTITNDSGPMHMSTSVGTPVMAVFGPTSPTLGFAPLGSCDRIFQVPLDCRPCSIHGSRLCRRGDLKCLAEVKPEYILEEAIPLLKEELFCQQKYRQ